MSNAVINVIPKPIIPGSVSTGKHSEGWHRFISYSLEPSLVCCGGSKEAGRLHCGLPRLITLSVFRCARFFPLWSIHNGCHTVILSQTQTHSREGVVLLNVRGQ